MSVAYTVLIPRGGPPPRAARRFGYSGPPLRPPVWGGVSPRAAQCFDVDARFRAVASVGVGVGIS
eukprot:1208903-Lingulodinium_polyedra.AAC.1